MDFKVDGLELNGDQVKAVIKFEANVSDWGSSRSLSDSSLVYKIAEDISNRLADKIMLERGPAIMEQVSNNQIINAILLKLAKNVG